MAKRRRKNRSRRRRYDRFGDSGAMAEAAYSLTFYTGPEGAEIVRRLEAGEVVRTPREGEEDIPT